jgi:hypothetical protein
MICYKESIPPSYSGQNLIDEYNTTTQIINCVVFNKFKRYRKILQLEEIASEAHYLFIDPAKRSKINSVGDFNRELNRSIDNLLSSIGGKYKATQRESVILDDIGVSDKVSKWEILDEIQGIVSLHNLQWGDLLSWFLEDYTFNQIIGLNNDKYSHKMYKSRLNRTLAEIVDYIRPIIGAKYGSY